MRKQEVRDSEHVGIIAHVREYTKLRSLRPECGSNCIRLPSVWLCDRVIVSRKPKDFLLNLLADEVGGITRFGKSGAALPLFGSAGVAAEASVETLRLSRILHGVRESIATRESQRIFDDKGIPRVIY